MRNAQKRPKVYFSDADSMYNIPTDLREINCTAKQFSVYCVNKTLTVQRFTRKTRNALAIVCRPSPLRRGREENRISYFCTTSSTMIIVDVLPMASLINILKSTVTYII